jgi:hypothetical protein
VAWIEALGGTVPGGTIITPEIPRYIEDPETGALIENPEYKALSSPWSNQVVSGTQGAGMPGETGDTIIIVNIGNEELKRYIVNAVGEEVRQ